MLELLIRSASTLFLVRVKLLHSNCLCLRCCQSAEKTAHHLANSALLDPVVKGTDDKNRSDCHESSLGDQTVQSEGDALAARAATLPNIFDDLNLFWIAELQRTLLLLVLSFGT